MMAASKSYILCWGTPAGRSKSASEPATLREVAVRVSYILYDNDVADKREAQKFAAYALQNWKDDRSTLVQHKSGYTFTIVTD